jgi:hypothetical protein
VTPGNDGRPRLGEHDRITVEENDKAHGSASLPVRATVAYRLRRQDADHRLVYLVAGRDADRLAREVEDWSAAEEHLLALGLAAVVPQSVNFVRRAARALGW